MARVWQYVVDAVTSPGEQLTRGQAWLRKFWSISAYGYRQLSRHRAEGMAAELSYRTIFSLIPLVVLGLVTFRIVGGLDEVQSQVEEQLYDFFGVPEIPVDSYVTIEPVDSQSGGEQSASEQSGGDGLGQGSGPLQNSASSGMMTEDASVPRRPAEIAVDAIAASVPPPDIAGSDAGGDGVLGTVPGDDGASGDDDQADQMLEAAAAKGAIQRTLREVTAKVSSLDFKTIGVVGLLVFIYAAVTLAESVEHLFNIIYEAPEGRPMHIRFAIQWSVLTLGSGLLALSLYLSSQAVDWVGQSGLGSSGANVASHFLSIVASWVLLFLAYALMPNTHVSVTAAATGALVGSMLWEAAKAAFAIYVNNALPYAALYGSIGLIPLFLFWIYVTWLIILFGLILTRALQEHRGAIPNEDPGRDDRLPKGDPDWMLPIMAEIATAFDRGQAVTYQTLGENVGLSSRIVHDMTSRLIQRGFVRRVGVGAGDDEGLALARPADKISVAEILQLAHSVKPTNDHPAWDALEGLQRAELHAAGSATLADIGVPPPPPPPNHQERPA